MLLCSGPLGGTEGWWCAVSLSSDGSGEEEERADAERGGEQSRSPLEQVLQERQHKHQEMMVSSLLKCVC